MNESSDLGNQIVVEVLKNENSKQELVNLIRRIFSNVNGVRISFNEDNDVEVHFTERFFNQNQFRKGKYLDTLNYSSILRFHKIMKTLAGEAMSEKGRIDWAVKSSPQLTKENLNMKIAFGLPCASLNKKIDEISVQELLDHLKDIWQKICEQLRFYEYDFHT